MMTCTAVGFYRVRGTRTRPRHRGRHGQIGQSNLLPAAAVHTYCEPIGAGYLLVWGTNRYDPIREECRLAGDAVADGLAHAADDGRAARLRDCTPDRTNESG